MVFSDLTLLKLFFSSRELYEKYGSYVRKESLSFQAKMILRDLKKYYETYDLPVADMKTFIPWFMQMQHQDLNETKSQLYLQLFQLVEEQEIRLDDKFVSDLLGHFKAEDFKERFKKHLENPEGWSTDVLTQMIEQYTSAQSLTEKAEEFDDSDIDEVLAQEDRAGGLQWRLKCLQKAVGRLILTDFVIVAAYVNTGKTAFLVSEVSNFAQQITEGCVLWFTNEQKPAKIKRRLMEATLMVTHETLVAQAEECKAEYTKRMHGDFHRVKIVDTPGNFKVRDIIRIAKRYNPKLIVVDMIDKLLHGKVEARDDIRLQRLYQNVREVAKTIAPVIGTSQCSGDVTWINRETGDTGFKKYIEMHQLAGTKQGKQGEAEVMITIGRDPNMPSTRFLHVVKNNLPGDGSVEANIKSEVCFNDNFSLYTD